MPVRRSTAYERWAKPVLDRSFAVLLLVALSPVFAVVALLVRLQLGRGVIYRQDRIGKNGVPFKMLKFRTMEHDRRRGQDGTGRPDRRAGSDRRSGRDRRVAATSFAGPDRRTDRPDRRSGQRRSSDGDRRRTHKTVDDPRHTPLGRFLRASSLDELPQLINVLKGELSIVGPRPELPEVVARYHDWQFGRHHVKPGITGLWQVTERSNETPMHEHVATDLRYVDELSPRTDLRILLLTVPVLLGVDAARRGT